MPKPAPMPEQSRQLAAIMFTDIVGYTALMGEDEEKAFELLKKNRQVQRPIIERFNGKWLKEIGDGVLASFSTVSDAVYCAKEIQEACLKEYDLKLRIGIHQGEVVFEGEDVFGDGVNIASRLEPLAPVGGILVSESVHKNILNKKGIDSKFIREENLRNVKEPERIYEVKVEMAETSKPDPSATVDSSNQIEPSGQKPSNQRNIILGAIVIILMLVGYIFYINTSSREQTAEDAAESEINDKSIAVLAFDDMSPEGDQEYFCDGISDEIINNLAQIKELKVIGRSSSFQFKGQYYDHREVGEKLGVSTFLEGSIRKSGDKIRITAQLIDVEDGSHIWSQTFDRDLEDIFKIQDEISEAIAEKMKVSMGLTKRNPVDLQVYDLYLRARTLLHQRGTGVELSVKLFEQIIEQDSTYQPAWTGLAQALIVLPIWTQDDSPRGNWKISLSNAMRAVQKALSLDPNDPEALAAMATIFRRKRDYGKAYEYYEKAIAINDQSPVILEDYVQFLLQMGYVKKSLPYAQRMIDLDPLTPIYLLAYSCALHLNGLTQQALSALKKALSINPNISSLVHDLVWAYLNSNQIDSALYVMDKYSIPKNVQSDYIRQIEAVKQGNSDFVFGPKNPLYFAMNELNQMDALFHSLQLREKNETPMAGYHPVYAPLGLTYHSERFLSDPRMKELLRNYGLVEFWKEYGWPDRCRPVGSDDFVCE